MAPYLRHSGDVALLACNTEETATVEEEPALDLAA
jgi:hypothetical protein